MAPRKPFLLRTAPVVLAALNRWAADELRSVNGQVDFILRGALKQAGRLPTRATPHRGPTDSRENRHTPIQHPRSSL